MTPAAGRGGNPPSREHPISAGSASGRHPGPPAPDGAGDPSPRRLGQLASSRCPPLPAAGRCPQPPSPGHWPCASPEPCRPGGGTAWPSRRGGAAGLSGRGGGGGGGLGGRARSCSTSEGCGLSGDEGRRGSPAAGGRRRGPPGHRLSPPPPGERTAEVRQRASPCGRARQVSALSCRPLPLRARSRVPATEVVTLLGLAERVRAGGKRWRVIWGF